LAEPSEIVVTGIEKQIEDVGSAPEKYIVSGDALSVRCPGSLCHHSGYERRRVASTTAALALACWWPCVFGIEEQGLRLLKSYVEPTVIMLPSTSSVNFHARWLWRSACSAT